MAGVEVGVAGVCHGEVGGVHGFVGGEEGEVRDALFLGFGDGKAAGGGGGFKADGEEGDGVFGVVFGVFYGVKGGVDDADVGAVAAGVREGLLGAGDAEEVAEGGEGDAVLGEVDGFVDVGGGGDADGAAGAGDEGDGGGEEGADAVAEDGVGVGAADFHEAEGRARVGLEDALGGFDGGQNGGLLSFVVAKRGDVGGSGGGFGPTRSAANLPSRFCGGLRGGEGVVFRAAWLFFRRRSDVHRFARCPKAPALPKVGLASRRCGDRGRLRGGGGSGRFAPCPPGAVRRSDGVWCGVVWCLF